jgi:peptide/nickel transport system permease protein
MIAARLPATAELALAAMALALALGVPLGALTAAASGSWFDRLVSGGALVGVSMPTFWLGPSLILLFAVKLDWFPVSERGGLWHLALPALTLATGLAAVLTIATRAAVLETLREDYLRVAKAKGAGPLRLLFKHALANASSPLLTVVGLQFGATLTGAAIVETIFDWPGLGDLLFQAIQKRDYPTVQGTVLIIAVIYVAVNLAIDLGYGLVDPRARAST